jgi:hypothetical protein
MIRSSLFAVAPVSGNRKLTTPDSGKTPMVPRAL